MDRKFETGDVVQLKSGGFPMTIHSVDNAGNYLCCWHSDKGEPFSSFYRHDQLKEADQQQPPAGYSGKL